MKFFILILLSLTLLAPKSPATTCGWDGTVLWADNLPATYSITRELYPTGVSSGPSFYSVDFGTSFDAYFWTRNGAGLKGAPKPGNQLNDYKIVCIAEAP